MNADGGYSMAGAGIRERMERPGNAGGAEGVSGNANGYPTAGLGTRERVETRPIRAGRANEGLSAGGGTGSGVASRSMGPGYSMAGVGLRERVERPVSASVAEGGRGAAGAALYGNGNGAPAGAGVGSTREEWKRGNEAFAASLYSKAIEHYSNAVKQDPLNHILFSNRSAAYASLRLWDKAIADGNECVRLRPDWAKGYCRLGAAFEGQSDLDKAEKAYTEGLQREPENALLQISLFRVCGNEKTSIDHLQTGATAGKVKGGSRRTLSSSAAMEASGLGGHAVSGRGEGREGTLSLSLSIYISPPCLSFSSSTSTRTNMASTREREPGWAATWRACSHHNDTP